MSIKNLLTDNVKPDQTLKIQTLEAESMEIDNLVVDNSEINGLTVNTLDATTINSTNINSDLAEITQLNCDNIDCMDTITTNQLDSSNITNTGTITSDSISVDTQILLATTSYVDLPLQVYTQYTSNITFSIYSLSSAVLVNGLQIIRMGNICVVNLPIFGISGASAGPATGVITSDAIIPTEFRPFNSLTFLKSFTVLENVSLTPAFLRYAGAGDFTFSISKVNLANWMTGAVNIVNNYQINFSYLTLPF